MIEEELFGIHDDPDEVFKSLLVRGLRRERLRIRGGKRALSLQVTQGQLQFFIRGIAGESPQFANDVVRR